MKPFGVARRAGDACPASLRIAAIRIARGYPEAETCRCHLHLRTNCRLSAHYRYITFSGETLSVHNHFTAWLVSESKKSSA